MFDKLELTEVFCHFIQTDLNGLVIGWVFRVFCEEPEVKLQNSIQGFCGTLTNDLAKDSVIWVFKWCGNRIRLFAPVLQVYIGYIFDAALCIGCYIHTNICANLKFRE